MNIEAVRAGADRVWQGIVSDYGVLRRNVALYPGWASTLIVAQTLTLVGLYVWHLVSRI